MTSLTSGRLAGAIPYSEVRIQSVSRAGPENTMYLWQPDTQIPVLVDEEWLNYSVLHVVLTYGTCLGLGEKRCTENFVPDKA